MYTKNISIQSNLDIPAIPMTNRNILNLKIKWLLNSVLLS